MTWVCLVTAQVCNCNLSNAAMGECCPSTLVLRYIFHHKINFWCICTYCLVAWVNNAAYKGLLTQSHYIGYSCTHCSNLLICLAIAHDYDIITTIASRRLNMVIVLMHHKFVRYNYYSNDLQYTAIMNSRPVLVHCRYTEQRNHYCVNLVHSA